jgi:ABC-type antimicrobial peptide transport system permease subunit
MQKFPNHNKKAFIYVPSAEKDVARVINLKDIKKTLASATRTFTYLLAPLVSISLLIGGIGIMSIMFVSASEKKQKK